MEMHKNISSPRGVAKSSIESDGQLVRVRHHVHHFKWHCEYVTESLEAERTNKYEEIPISVYSHFRFYRSRLGLLRNIDSLELEIDEEMWFSVTPEGIAKSHARSFRAVIEAGILLDAFCGLGGDMIHLRPGIFSVGCDISEARLRTARSLHAQVGKNQTDYVLANSMSRRSCFRSHAFHVVYLSPPWGHCGIRNRKQAPVFGRRKLSSLDVNGFTVFERALALTNDSCIAYYLPRGMDLTEIQELAEIAGDSSRLFIDVHASYDPDDETCAGSEIHKVRAVTAYFGPLADSKLV